MSCYVLICMWMLLFVLVFFFFKQKTAYEMRISDWSSDVCSSDLLRKFLLRGFGGGHELAQVPGQLQVRADPPAGEQQRCQPQQGEGDARAGIHAEIGRASCRERVCQYV